MAKRVQIFPVVPWPCPASQLRISAVGRTESRSHAMASLDLSYAAWPSRASRAYGKSPAIPSTQICNVITDRALICASCSHPVGACFSVCRQQKHVAGLLHPQPWCNAHPLGSNQIARLFPVRAREAAGLLVWLLRNSMILQLQKKFPFQNILITRGCDRRILVTWPRKPSMRGLLLRPGGHLMQMTPS